MKILLVSEFFPIGKNLRFSGGVEARTFFLAKYLAYRQADLAKRHKVTIICTKHKGSKTKETMFGFRVFRVGPERRYEATVSDIINRLRFIKEAVKFGQTIDIDIVDGSNFIAHFIAKMIARRKKIPSVAWYPDVWIGSWFSNAGLFGLFGEILERLNLILGFDSYIAISKQTAQKLKKHVSGKINVISCGVDQKEFSIPTKKFNNPTIICISRLVKYKNLKTLIFAFAHLTTKLANVRLIIVGSGPEYNSLKNLAKGLKINSKVKFLANLPRKKLIQLIKSSHIFSLPSLVEGFGISTIESASAGLSYVISDIAVHREITRGGKGGFLVDPNNPILFSQRFYDLLTKKDLYNQKGKHARELAEFYNWQKIAKDTKELYQRVLKRL